MRSLWNSTIKLSTPQHPSLVASQSSAKGKAPTFDPSKSEVSAFDPSDYDNPQSPSLNTTSPGINPNGYWIQSEIYSNQTYGLNPHQPSKDPTIDKEGYTLINGLENITNLGIKLNDPENEHYDNIDHGVPQKPEANPEPKAVTKSWWYPTTLINLVFGASATESSDRIKSKSDISRSNSDVSESDSVLANEDFIITRSTPSSINNSPSASAGNTYDRLGSSTRRPSEASDTKNQLQLTPYASKAVTSQTPKFDTLIKLASAIKVKEGNTERYVSEIKELVAEKLKIKDWTDLETSQIDRLNQIGDIVTNEIKKATAPREKAQFKQAGFLKQALIRATDQVIAEIDNEYEVVSD